MEDKNIINNNASPTDNSGSDYLTIAAQIIAQSPSLENTWLQFLLQIKTLEYKESNEKNYTAGQMATFQTNLANSITTLKQAANSSNNDENNNASQTSLYDQLSAPIIKDNPRICFYIFDFILDDHMNLCEEKAQFLCSFIKQIGLNQSANILKHFYISNFYEIKETNDQTYQELLKILVTPYGLEALKQQYPDPDDFDMIDAIEEITEDDINNLRLKMSYNSADIIKIIPKNHEKQYMSDLDISDEDDGINSDNDVSQTSFSDRADNEADNDVTYASDYDSDQSNNSAMSMSS